MAYIGPRRKVKEREDSGIAPRRADDRCRLEHQSLAPEISVSDRRFQPPNSFALSDEIFSSNNQILSDDVQSPAARFPRTSQCPLQVGNCAYRSEVTSNPSQAVPGAAVATGLHDNEVSARNLDSEAESNVMASTAGNPGRRQLTLKIIRELEERLSLSAAAAHLGISTSDLRCVCRQHGISRWSHRAHAATAAAVAAPEERAVAYTANLRRRYSGGSAAKDSESQAPPTSEAHGRLNRENTAQEHDQRQDSQDQAQGEQAQRGGDGGCRGDGGAG